MATTVDEVLLLLNRQVSEELGPALWAVLEEVAAFYNLGGQRAIFRRICLSEDEPSSLTQGRGGPSAFARVWNAVFGSDDPPAKVRVAEERMVQRSFENEWQGTLGSYSRTYDARKIAAVVRKLLGETEAGAATLIVTDQELAPPPDWRYVVMDGDLDQGMVISTVPLDPHYWRINDSDRVALIKHRVRACCLQIVGRILRLEGCDNPRCFLFQWSDSVRNLDHMVELGSEHQMDGLTGRGYRIRVSNPNEVQPSEPGLALELEKY